MRSQSTSKEELFDLLQHTYFDGVDTANADQAAEAMHEEVEWIHTQVWEHDGHDSSTTDTLNGREAVREFLANRIGEMQVEGIEHKVDTVVTDGDSGAFRANVVGADGSKVPFFGWVEIRDGKISSYRVFPER